MARRVIAKHRPIASPGAAIFPQPQMKDRQTHVRNH
jgi:hypothetical protein